MSTKSVLMRPQGLLPRTVCPLVPLATPPLRTAIEGKLEEKRRRKGKKIMVLDDIKDGITYVS